MMNKKDQKKETEKKSGRQMPDENLKKKSGEERSSGTTKVDISKTNKDSGCCC